jgi:hypothetical protein
MSDDVKEGCDNSATHIVLKTEEYKALIDKVAELEAENARLKARPSMTITRFREILSEDCLFKELDEELQRCCVEPKCSKP